jgi:hypothetical protein
MWSPAVDTGVMALFGDSSFLAGSVFFAGSTLVAESTLGSSSFGIQII